MSSIKIRASMVGDSAEVKCLMNHPMETGLRKDAKTCLLYTSPSPRDS